MLSGQTHTAEFIKRQAKKLKKQQNLSHHVALDKVSQTCGFANWLHFCNTQNASSNAAPHENTNKVISFTLWLAKHRKRDSPLGDLAKDAAADHSWPDASTLEIYLNHLWASGASSDAAAALNRAWRAYQLFLKRSALPTNREPVKRKASVTTKPAKRRIALVKNVKPLHFSKRVAEKFEVGDEAWVCFGGSRALPAVVIEVDERHYTVKFDRPSKRIGITRDSQNSLFLDEVRSTPELAVLNCVTS
jgi:hypothetical protein